MRRKDRAQEKIRRIKKAKETEMSRLISSYLIQNGGKIPRMSPSRMGYWDIGMRAFPIQPMTHPVGAIFYHNLPKEAGD